MSKSKAFKDPRGHSIRIYSEVFDSPAFGALSPHDVLVRIPANVTDDSGPS